MDWKCCARNIGKICPVGIHMFQIQWSTFEYDLCYLNSVSPFSRKNLPNCKMKKEEVLMWTVSCLALAVNSFKTVKWGSNCPLSQQQLDLMHVLILRERKTIKMFNHSFCIGFAPYLCLEEMPTNWIYSLWFGFTSFFGQNSCFYFCIYALLFFSFFFNLHVKAQVQYWLLDH